MISDKTEVMHNRRHTTETTVRKELVSAALTAETMWLVKTDLSKVQNSEGRRCLKNRTKKIATPEKIKNPT
jgi:hypothetical protein